MSRYSICLGCMQEKGDAEVCPYCGYREGTPPLAPHYLRPGTVLAGKYLVGRGLGHGGFGTTYIARDQVLGIKLAIKEYLPQDCASRAPGSNMVVPFSGDGAKRFADGLESFLQEARTLARFDGSPNIVGVRDFFTENGTAYLVMNYLEGITLKQYLVRSGGKPVPFEKMLGILLPVMDALRTVHAAGLLHRDVSPDNIFLTTSGQVTLIDFGAARQSMNLNVQNVQQQSVSVILKPGYAPEEQYRSHGRQGPWTDIYALGATMYRTLTGRIPPEALDRLENDTLVPPSKLGIRIPAYAEAAILRAMAVHAENRFQTVDEFRAALLKGAQQPARPVRDQSAQEPVRRREPAPAPSRAERAQQTQQKKAKKKKRAGTVVLLVLVALLLIVVLLFVYYMTQVAGNPQISLRSEEPSSTQQTEVTPTPTPSQTEETQPSVTPSPSPSPTPIDPALLPFIEGTAEQSAATDFVPAKNRRIVAEEEGQQTIWITGRAPSAATKILVAQFVYDEVNNAAVGGVYGYYQDDQGNLRYASMEEGGSDLLMLPAECVVGAKFSGMLGASRVYAVNYSGKISGVKMKDAVVVSCESGYAFYEKGKGLVLIQSDFDSGDVLYRIVSDEPDNKGIYSEYVD